MRHSSLLNPSLTKWYTTDNVFFLRTKSRCDIFHCTDWLSPYIKHGLLIGMPICLNFIRKPLRYSHNDFIARNSLPKELVLQAVWCLEYQYIGALLSITINPVRDLLVTLSPAKSASTNALPNYSLPKGCGTVRWYHLTCITIVLFPFSSWECLHINFQIAGVKDHATVVMPFQIHKNIE